jgi:hypothetical protein
MKMIVTMKRNLFSAVVHLAITAIGALFLLAGCASADIADQESLLAATGFRTVTPQTSQQHMAYTAVPPYKLQRAVANDEVFYVYRDEKKGWVYIGGEPEYQRYQQLVIQRDIARDHFQAAHLNNQAAAGWYGAYGRW